MAKDYIDLDAFLAEQAKKAPKMLWKGSIRPLASGLKWSTMLKAQDMAEKQTDINEIGQMLKKLVGPELYAEFEEIDLDFGARLFLFNEALEAHMKALGMGDPKARAEMERMRQASVSESETPQRTSERSRQTSGGTIRLAAAN